MSDELSFEELISRYDYYSLTLFDEEFPGGIPYGQHGLFMTIKGEMYEPQNGLRWTKDVMSEDNIVQNPYTGQQLRRVSDWHLADDSSQDSGDNANREVVTDEVQATIATSEALPTSLGVPLFMVPEGLMHRPLLDIDMRAKLIPSSTPDHFHLFIDKPMTWDQYVRLLDVMAEVGILEQGYVNASKARGYTAVRLPWVRKDV